MDTTTSATYCTRKYSLPFLSNKFPLCYYTLSYSAKERREENPRRHTKIDVIIADMREPCQRPRRQGSMQRARSQSRIQNLRGSPSRVPFIAQMPNAPLLNSDEPVLIHSNWWVSVAC